MIGGPAEREDPAAGEPEDGAGEDRRADRQRLEVDVPPAGRGVQQDQERQRQAGEAAA